MSRKPVDVRRALETLRQERPALEATERVLVALRTPPLPEGRTRRRRLARPLTAAMITAALAIVVFTPRTHAGAAWAQTLAATLDVATHAISTDSGGDRQEEWREGARYAVITTRSDGTLMMESRTDGVRWFSTINSAGFDHQKANPNAQTYGIVYTMHRAFVSLGRDFGSLDRLLKRSDVAVVGHNDADPSKGTPERYHLRLDKGVNLEIVAEVDPNVRRIKALSVPLIGRRTEIDYPGSIPASVFTPRAQIGKGLPTYDVDALKTIVKERLGRGLGRKGPVTLRLVTLDADGTLWAFWSGAPPSRDLKPEIRFRGLPTGPAFGMRVFTADWKTAPAARGNPHYRAGGPHLGGMGMIPKVKVGLWVDLDVPYSSGIAHFRNVPVLRIANLSHFDEELGVERTFR